MKQMCVYILECSDGSLYTGVTNDLERRILEHNTGISDDSYTVNRRPVKLVFHEIFQDPTSAINMEKKIKKWSKNKKLALINGDWDKLKELSICKNDTNYLNYKKS
jgi:putative endonuclease